MSRQHHYLKIQPKYYLAIESGEKTFEVRFNDRNYQKYDILHLREWAGGQYTGRVIVAEVTYISNLLDFDIEGYVIMSIKVVAIHKLT